jgi:sugar phosphate isomerase/epimerase
MTGPRPAGPKEQHVSVERVLWEACVRAHPYEQQLDATVAGGFDALSMPPHVALANAERGLSAPQMRAMAQDRGVTLSHLDGGIGFMPAALPSGATPRLVRRFGIPREQVLDLASDLGVHCLCTVGIFDQGLFRDELIGGFQQLCDVAAERGMDVTLEPMAFYGMQDFRLAAEVVREAGRPNGALLFDGWHFTRVGPDLALLPELHTCGPIDVQVNDGAAEPLGASVMEDSTDHRMFPGEGAFDTTGYLRAIGPEHIRSFGVEIFSAELDRVPAVEAGRRAGQALRDVAQSVGLALE